jgi:LysM repeat protein
MKLLRIPKLPKFRLPPPRKTPPPPKKLQARMRTADAPMGAYEDDEPQTKLTSAFIVVLILHVVAVGGIYAFNQIKASRRSLEAAAPATTPKSASSEPARKSAATQPEPARPAKPAAASQAHTTAPAAPVAPILKQRVYNVKPGDNLQAIAKTFGVTTADLKAANGLNSDMIHPGQVLNLPAARPTSEAPSAPARTAETTETKSTGKTYTVKSGDRLVFIAKRFGVTQEDLIVANKIKDPAKLQIGQTLKIPGRKGN